MAVGSERRSFHVRYAGVDGSVRDRAVDALESTYRVTTVAGVDSTADLLADDVDCLVLAAGATAESRSVVDCLESVAAARPDVPIVPFVSRSELTDNRPEWVRALLRASVDDVVFRDAGSEPGTDAPRRLRDRIDAVYEASISDAGETVLEVARSLMGAAHDEVDIEIEWGLESVGRRLDADRALVFEYDGDDERLVPTHSWFARPESTDSEPEPLPAASFPGFEEAIRAFDVHAVPAGTDTETATGTVGEPAIDLGTEEGLEIPEGFIGDLGAAAGIRGGTDRGSPDRSRDPHPYLEVRDLEALLAVPIVVDWELTGVLAVAGRQCRPWPEQLRRQLRTLGELVGYRLERRQRRGELVSQNERLEGFASVVSHDLRNPLNVISGSAELVAETGDDAYLEDVIDAADRMEAMIDDLLTLARDGARVGDTEPVALESVVRDAWDDVATDGATLELEPDDLPTLEADRGRLRQAFENLIRNAIEHNGDAVSIRVEATDEGFAFEDDGVGIPEDRREQIFEEGYTGDGGTGLGLSIVDRIVSAHGWSVSVTDGDEGGARFEITTE
ncbi:sensor histidine kinase [Natronobacterium lacisalsi]|uniref:sensor histidine kinase n=1 Tax=Natronobacterium lacisalsi TaxID=229731 RepID=UPI001F4CEC8C|nr:ATP-binding protein [Halobiforma lacisalsi]